MKLYSFLGEEREDIVYYIAQSLSNLNKTTLVVDNSQSQSLFKSIRKTEDAISVELGNTLILSRKKYSANNYEKFDTVLVLHGLNPDQEIIDASDKTFLMLTYLPSSLNALADEMDFSLFNQIEVEKKAILYLDKPSGKVAEEYLKKILGIDPVEDETTIGLNEVDISMRHYLQYNGASQIRGLSAEMRDFIKRFSAEHEEKGNHLELLNFKRRGKA